MSKNKIYLKQGEDMIENLVETYVDNKVTDGPDVKNLLREKIIDTVYNIVIEKEKNRIEQEAKDKIDKEEEKRKRREIKVVIIETLIIGFLVGLLVNQFTDVISYTKGVNINIMTTLLWIFILLLFSFAFAFLMYTNRIDDFVYNMENKAK